MSNANLLCTLLSYSTILYIVVIKNVGLPAPYIYPVNESPSIKSISNDFLVVEFADAPFEYSLKTFPFLYKRK